MSRSLSSSQLSDPVTTLLGAPSLWHDEDPVQFDELMAALTAEFSPATAYERILVRNISELQWDMLRHRRLQKTLLRRQIPQVAALALQGRPAMPLE